MAIGDLFFSQALDGGADSTSCQCQATIAENFRDGKPLEKTIEALCSNPGMIKKIPYINVVDNEGRHVAMDNR